MKSQPMKSIGLLVKSIGLLALFLSLAFIVETARADYPKPSPYPISWELEFTHALPTRIAVKVAGDDVPEPFWYMTWHAVNPITHDPQKDQERPFYPVFEMLTSDGRVIRSDDALPIEAFEAVKQRTGNKFLLDANQLPTTIRLGEDEAIDGVAIWREPMQRMGRFSIFVTGLCGETATVDGPDGKPIILHKTLQLNFHINGDENYPSEDQVNELPEEWIMR